MIIDCAQRNHVLRDGGGERQKAVYSFGDDGRVLSVFDGSSSPAGYPPFKDKSEPSFRRGESRQMGDGRFPKRLPVGCGGGGRGALMSGRRDMMFFLS